MNDNYPKNYTVIDTETTGFSYRNSELLELSAIKVRKDKIVDTFSMLVKPKLNIPYHITKLTGIDDDMVKDALDIEDVIIKYIEFIGDDIVVGHNVIFDINFINENTTKTLGMLFNNEYVDTLSMSRMIWFNCNSHKLTDLIDRCNLDGKQEHRGLSDCMYTYQAYLYMKNLLKKAK